MRIIHKEANTNENLIKTSSNVNKLSIILIYVIPGSLYNNYVQ